MNTVVVTGANRGIGLEFCRFFKSEKWNVIGVCRSDSAELNELDIRVEKGVDISISDDINRLSKTLADTKIDLLINNAGILSIETIETFDPAAVKKQFEVNSIAPIQLSIALLGSMSAGSKIAMITSRMGAISDNSSGGYYGYRMSKAALNIAAVSLSKDLAKDGILVGVYHPGFVRTEMTGNQGNIDAKQSVAGICSKIESLSKETSGVFYHTNGEILDW